MTSNNLNSPMKFCYNTNSTLSKQCQSSKSVLQDGSRTFGLFWKEKTLSYNRRNTVLSCFPRIFNNTKNVAFCLLLCITKAFQKGVYFEWNEFGLGRTNSGVQYVIYGRKIGSVTKSMQLKFEQYEYQHLF